MSDCAILDCTKPSLTRGWCSAHYNRYKRHGDPLGGRYSRFQPVAPRFWTRVVRDPDTECWWWIGLKDTSGYGRICVLAKTRPAHRVSYEMIVGPIPEGLEIDHLCRNRACVNPDHLEPVTTAENIRRSPINYSARLARQTHCKRGHEYTPENTWTSGTTGRSCRTCKREMARLRPPRKRNGR